MSNSGHPSDPHSKRIRTPKRFSSPENNKESNPKKPKTEKPSASKKAKTAKTATAKTAAVIPATQPRSNCKIQTLLGDLYLGEGKGWSKGKEYSTQMNMDEYITSIVTNIGNQLSIVPDNPGEYQMLIQNAVMKDLTENERGIIHYTLYLIPARRVDKENQLPDELRDKIIEKITTSLTNFYPTHTDLEGIVNEISKIKKKYTLIAIPRGIWYAITSDKNSYNDIFKQYINGHKKVVDVVDCDAIVSDKGGSLMYKKKRHIYKTRKGNGRNGKSKSKNGKSKSKSRKQNRRY